MEIPACTYNGQKVPPSQYDSPLTTIDGRAGVPAAWRQHYRRHAAQHRFLPTAKDLLCLMLANRRFAAKSIASSGGGAAAAAPELVCTSRRGGTAVVGGLQRAGAWVAFSTHFNARGRCRGSIFRLVDGKFRLPRGTILHGLPTSKWLGKLGRGHRPAPLPQNTRENNNKSRPHCVRNTPGWQ